MKTQELKLKINKQLGEINAKILQLKDQHHKEKMDREFLELIADLEALRVDVLHQYNLLNSIRSEENEEKKLKQIETAVSQSTKTFDTVFKKSGTSISSSRIKTRERSIDFNNPTRTR